mgnify:CR=1 FL=1
MITCTYQRCMAGVEIVGGEDIVLIVGLDAVDLFVVDLFVVDLLVVDLGIVKCAMSSTNMMS